MPEAVIVDAIRTPIGRAAKGSLKDVRTDDLAAMPLKALVERNPGVDFARDRRRDDGLRLPARRGGLQHRPQRFAAGRASTITSPATTVNRFCASSLQTIRMAFHAIKAGEGDQYIAAGVEAVSRFPAQAPYDPHSQLDGSEGAPFNVYIPMGLTAENVAKRCKVSREAQDEWAKTSQDRAVAARDSGHFDAEIVPVARRRGRARRRPAAGHDDGEARRAQAGVRPRERHRHGRQLLPAQRRRGGRARDVGGEGRGARAGAARRGSSPRRWPRSGPRSWASARSRPSRPCSSRPA